MSDAVPPPSGNQPSGRPDAPNVEQQRALVQAALRGAGIPRLYANGLGTAQTAADMTVILLNNGNPVGTVTLSYTTVKQLVNAFQTAIKNMEAATGQEIKPLNDLTEALHQAMAKTDARLL